MKDITLKDLLEAGCHFGHQSNRWHPKANDYIYTERDGVHIIDLAKTLSGLVAAGEYLRNLAATGGSFLVVGTKRQAKPIAQEEIVKVQEALGENSGFHYLLERWPGGMLTNFDVMHKNISKMGELIQKSDDATLTKKERLLAKREYDKLTKNYGGIKSLTKLPNAIFLIDPKKEQGCVREATSANVKIVAICDSNCNPDPVSFAIPANDDAVGSIKIIFDYLTEAWIEGRMEYNKNKANEASKTSKLSDSEGKDSDTVTK